MSMRFRYRSSPRFDSFDLACAGAVSVSVRDLRARILGPALRRHFDLLISDAASNRLLDDDTLLIPAGSDLVVKRVPIASNVGGGGGESSNPHKTAEEQHGCGRSDRGEVIASLLSPLDKFDDPCNMLCPGLEAELSESCADDVELEESSNKRCTINDLLPNLSLRKAIEHFLETQPAGVVGFDDPGPMYAPDVESGIEAKEASCALSIHQQEQKLPCSPSATGKDSNQIMPNLTKEIERSSSIKIRLDENKPPETASALDRNGHKEASRNADFQGSASSSKVYQNIAQENDDLPTLGAKALRNSSDGSGFAAPAAIRARKGGRTCYMCGSPNHLIRDCPVASNIHSENSTFHGDAYGPSNWQGSMFHPLQSYGNIYVTPAIIPFDPGVVPASPFGVPSYMQPFYGGMKNPYALMGMGGTPSPVFPGVQQPLSHTGFMGIHDNAKSHKAPSGRGVREYGYDSSSEDCHDEDGRRISHKQYQTEKRSERYYDEGSTRVQKMHRKDKFGSPAREKPCYSWDEEFVDQKHRKEFDSYGRERRKRYSEQSASEPHDMSDNSIQDTKQRSKQHYRSASGKRDASRAKCKSVYSEKTRRRSHNERSHTDRADDGHKSSKNTYRHKHRDHETDHSVGYKRDSKVKVSSQSSRHAKTKVGSSDGLLENDRWEMVDGPYDYERRDHYRHKRKGIH